MINVLGRPSPRSASAGTTSCTNDMSSTRWNSSFRSTGNWDRSIDARRTIPGKRLPGPISRRSSRPTGNCSEYPQFEHRSMLLSEYVVEFPTLRARGRRSTRHHQRATETLRRMRRLSGTPLRATSRRSGRRNPTASEARSTPEQRRGRAPSRRSLLPVPGRRRAQRIPRERVSEPGRSTHQPRSGDSLSSGRGNVGVLWQHRPHRERRAAVASPLGGLSHPPTGTSSSQAVAGRWGTTSRPRLTSTNEETTVACSRDRTWRYGVSGRMLSIASVAASVLTLLLISAAFASPRTRHLCRYSRATGMPPPPNATISDPTITASRA